MMKNWSIRHRIIGSLAAILALMIAMGGVIFVYLEGTAREAREVETNSLPGVYVTTQLLINLLENFALIERHVIMDDMIGMRDLEARIQANRAEEEALARQYEATLIGTEDRNLFERFEALHDAYNRIQDRVLELSRTGGEGDVNALITAEFDPEFERLRDAVQAMVDRNRADNDRSTRNITAAVASAQTGIAVSLVVALALAFICGYYLLRAITRPLGRLLDALDVMRQGDFTRRMTVDRRDEFGLLAEGFNRMSDELTTLVGQVQKSGIQVTTSITEIAATAKQQQATANEIAATTTEIGATSKEISATSRELVKTMNEVAEVADESTARASGGQASLSQMEETMHQVMDATGSINAKLAVLNEKAGNITQVITTITKVADQTNLLSLNAAIEAEKAGEYGRGFAVVATQIRRLADQTAVATYDIELIVKEIQSAVSASVMGMDKFSEEVRRGMQEIQQIGAQLSQFIQQVQTLAPRFEAVNEGMQAQAAGAGQITEALAQLSEAARQTVDSLRQSSMAIDELKQVANGLRGGVSRFRLQIQDAVSPVPTGQ